METDVCRLMASVRASWPATSKSFAAPVNRALRRNSPNEGAPRPRIMPAISSTMSSSKIVNPASRGRTAKSDRCFRRPSYLLLSARPTAVVLPIAPHYRVATGLIEQNPMSGNFPATGGTQSAKHAACAPNTGKSSVRPSSSHCGGEHKRHNSPPKKFDWLACSWRAVFGVRIRYARSACLTHDDFARRDRRPART